jgi:transposase
VLLAADGHRALQIAPLVRRSVDTVRRVVRRYQDGGAGAVP